MSKGMRTEDEVRDSAKLVLGFDKTEGQQPRLNRLAGYRRGLRGNP
jgi:hypothetical protein